MTDLLITAIRSPEEWAVFCHIPMELPSHPKFHPSQASPGISQPRGSDSFQGSCPATTTYTNAIQDLIEINVWAFGVIRSYKKNWASKVGTIENSYLTDHNLR